MVPHHYCLHVSPLHVKVAIITETDDKRRLTWGNGRDTKHVLADVGLYAEQAWGVDVSCEFLKPFRLRHVLYSECDVARPMWGCSNLRR